ncbi:DNA polymerase alpha-associated DNA helicase A [Erysiphe neolycopersici]|uniref:DNA helicase n=1 Tax=Erysiphe neolycopersici TaxID=212602 RepID=A0A420HXJ5_9PEZI|nr:DNA polymerase alpha-associated DNA helicase A [Erysiphe neolycopersici]
MPLDMALEISAFVNTQLNLLEQELVSSIEETSSQISNSTPKSLSRAGLAITNLVPISMRTGLGGKTIVELKPDVSIGNDVEIPTNGVRAGDIVALAEQPSGTARKSQVRDLEHRGMKGVIVKITSSRIALALEEKQDYQISDEAEAKLALLLNQKRLWVCKLADEVTHKRMKNVMERLGRMPEEEYSSLVRLLFGMDSLPSVCHFDEDLDWIDHKLNESQKEAVKFALGSQNVALIHGPPGTGKTHTLIELILQMIKRQKRILVCGPSNISVDNIVERLVSHKIPIVRLGHPARLLPTVLNNSLDVLIQSSEAAAIVKDIRKEMDSKQASIRKTKSGKERKQIYADLKELRKEYKYREKNVVTNLLGKCKVVLATLHGAGGFNMRDEIFDAVIIDEASQALEAQSWVPLLRAQKVILAGDHLQLPPTVKSLNSKINAKRTNSTIDESNIIKGMTLEKTLFSRLLELHGPKIKRMLTTQYRMNEKIMRFPSDELYGSKLISAEAVKNRLLIDLPYQVQETEDTIEPLIFFDTQGGDFPERNEEEVIIAAEKKKPDDTKIQIKRSGGIIGESKSNEMEAALAKYHVQKLIEAGVRTEDIAVITPYNAQLTLLNQSLKVLFPNIELGSVDGFQGREKEAVIISLVRSNSKREVGFLGDKRRINVAMTRPKRLLTVIGDSETLRNDEFFRRWIDFLEENSDLRYPSVDTLF